MADTIIIPIFIIVIMEVYLIVQARLDAKTGYVYSAPNDAILWFGLTVFTVYQLIDYRDIIVSVLEALLVGVLFYLMSAPFFKEKKVMQPSDAKAYTAIYLSSYMVVSQEYASYVLCIALIIANIAMVIYYRCIKRCGLNERKPYFPFILIGYTGAIIINMIAYHSGLPLTA